MNWRDRLKMALATPQPDKYPSAVSADCAVSYCEQETAAAFSGQFNPPPPPPGDTIAEKPWPAAVIPDPDMPRPEWNARASRAGWRWTAERLDGCIVVTLHRDG